MGIRHTSDGAIRLRRCTIRGCQTMTVDDHKNPVCAVCSAAVNCRALRAICEAVHTMDESVIDGAVADVRKECGLFTRKWREN